VTGRLWTHRIIAIIWTLSAIPAYLWWRDSVLFVIVASVFANIYAAVSALEAADDRAVIDRLERMERKIDEIPS
jgi:hypothetical protein